MSLPGLNMENIQGEKNEEDFNFYSRHTNVGRCGFC